MIARQWQDFLERARQGRVRAGLERRLRVFEAPGENPTDAVTVRDARGHALINFASNDYLGLAHHPAVREGAARAAMEYGAGAGASRLISGTHALHERLEARLTAMRGAEAALVFTTGYQANAGVLGALADSECVIVSDALNHASIVDGCRLSRAEVRVFPHCDYRAASDLLRDSAPGQRRLLVSDTLFSIDGDMADLPALRDIAREHAALLVLDDAHAFGALGASGRGAPELQGVDEREIGVVTGTFSKALGGLGGYACASAAIREHLLNHARAFIFTTAGPPAQLGAALAALDVLDRQGVALRERLMRNAARVRHGITALGYETGGQAQIVPLWIGDETRALSLSASLEARGLLVPAIRPPTVPAGRAMLRICVSAAHTDAHIDALLSALGACMP